MDVPTTERLARALEGERNATRDSRLTGLIVRARQGVYDDFKSPLPCGPSRLFQELVELGHCGFAERVRNGEFDATSEEAAEWARSPEGIETVNEVFGIGGFTPRYR
jgi:hypothetical protein